MSASPEVKKIARELATLRGPATEAIMLDDLQNVLRDERASTRKQNGQPDRKEDDMIHLGDTIIHPAATAATLVQSAPMSGLKKAALAAALLGAGGGLGAAVPFAVDALKPSTPPPVTAPIDADTLYELHIGGGGP